MFGRTKIRVSPRSIKLSRFYIVEYKTGLSFRWKKYSHVVSNGKDLYSLKILPVLFSDFDTACEKVVELAQEGNLKEYEKNLAVELDKKFNLLFGKDREFRSRTFSISLPVEKE